MKMKICVLLFLIASGSCLWSGGEAEESVERGEYLAGKGIIIPPEEVFEDSYVSAVDYQYPDPEAAFGVNLYSGHRQLSTQGQEEVFLISIQGRRPTYEDLPPMNHVFVIDKSGSMYQSDKMNWVKESFGVFMETVRSKDYVSLVVFDDTARTLFPSRRMDTEGIRQRYIESVHALKPGGGSNVKSALQLAYKEALSNYRKDYVNRVLFLTDGVGDIEEIYGIADVYREIGVNVTAIGMGEDCDIQFLRNLADRAGGSSRFLSGKDKIHEIFGEEFVRMVIPAARNVELNLHLLDNLQNLKTWGYHSRIEGLWDGYEQKADAVPFGLGTDAAGNVYIADDAKNQIQKYSADGNLLIQWGRLGRRNWNPEGSEEVDEMEGKFSHPRGISVDPQGYVYVADSGNHRIQKFDTNGNFVIQWGGPGTTTGKFQQPADVAVNAGGYVYVADSGNHRIQRFDADGEFITQWGSEGSEPGQFRTPIALAVDIYSNVYVADMKNRRLQIFESDGTFIAKIEDESLNIVPVGIALDDESNIYIADNNAGKVRKLALDRSYLTDWGSFGDRGRAFDDITAIAVDASQNILIADAANSRIQKFDASGNFMIKQPLKFFIPTVNLGDYETIVIRGFVPKQDTEGSRTIARLTGTYTDVNGDSVAMDPCNFSVKFVPFADPVSGFSNATVLRAATILHYAQALKSIGAHYYDGDVRAALDLTYAAKNELYNAQVRLGDQSLSKEVAILDKYIEIMTPEADLSKEETQLLAGQTEMGPVVKDRSLDEHLNNLFDELLLELGGRKAGNIAVTEFSFQDGHSAQMLEVLNAKAASSLADLANLYDYSVVTSKAIEQTLSEHMITCSDLVDTNTALKVGELLNARYIITGTIVEMNMSVVVFCRVIDVQTGAIISVSQVILPKNSEILSLL